MKQLQKVMPQLQKMAKQAQEAFSKVDTKQMQGKVQQAVNYVKKKVQDLKRSTENNKIAINVTNKDASKQITQLEKEIDSLQKKINARQIKLNVINPQIDSIVESTRKEVTPAGVNPNSLTMDKTVDNALSKNKDFTSLNSQAQKLYTEIETYNSLLDTAKSKMAGLKQEINSTATTQNKLSSFFSAFKNKLEQSKSLFSSMKNGFKGLPQITQNITNNIKNISSGIKSGLSHVLKYAGALLSIRGIYGTLRSSANAWLSSQNAGAQQLSANIEYMKYAMGSALAPVIQFVTNLVYQLMKAIQSVAYALTGVNIFAKATASSMKSAAGSAKQTSKSLAGVHSEINNVSDNKSSGGGGGATPNMDLSTMDGQMSAMAQKLYDFFKPLKESWDIYGPMVTEAFKNTISGIGASASAMWTSVEQIITNGTVYEIISNILNSIGQIGQAWANAWKNDNNGTELIQNVADMINDITQAILNLVSSTGFQTFLNGLINAFNGLSQFIKPVVEDLLNLLEPIGEIALSVAGTVLNSIGDALKWIGNNEVAVTIVESLAIAIGLVTIATKLFKLAKSEETAVLIKNAAAWVAANLPIVLITAAIAAVIAIIILCVKHWDEIKTTVINVCNKIKKTVTQWKDNIAQTFSNLKTAIVNKATEIKDGIKQKFQDAYNGIKNTFNNIGNFFSGVWNKIKNTFSALGTSIGNAISGAVKTGINGVISLIERTINGAIRLINGGIRMINLIPGVNIGNISTLSLPRLAKGGVLTQETAFIGGEYSGARSNPEIVTPQNIMYDTMRRALSDSDFNSNNDTPIYLTVQVGNTKLGQILLEDLRDMKRRTGKDIEAIVGG